MKDINRHTSDSIVILDQAAGQVQVAILDAFRSTYRFRAIIAGSINARGKKLDKDVVWEKAIPYDRTNMVKRFFSWIVFSIQALVIIKRRYPTADLFIITNPPLTVFLSFFLKNKFDILVFDLFPDALAEYNYISRRSWIYRQWEKWNVQLFDKARRVFTLSDGMADKLSAYMDPKKIEVIPLWTDNSFLQPIPKNENPFVVKWGLKDKFTVMYSGNMGLTHPVELLVDIAHRLQEDEDIFFLLIGGGHKFSMLEERIKSADLRNIRLLPWQSADMLPFSMNAADMGVVTLDDQASKLSVPSKIFDLFSIGVPVLGIGAANSELSRLLNTYQAGKCFSDKQVDEMADYIRMLKENQVYRNETKERSLQASLNHTPVNAKKFL